MIIILRIWHTCSSCRWGATTHRNKYQTKKRLLVTSFLKASAPALSDTLLSCHPLLSSQFSKSRKSLPLITVITSIKHAVMVTICEVPTGLFLLSLPVLNSHTVSITCLYSLKWCITRGITSNFLVYFRKSLKCQKWMFLIWGQMSFQHWLYLCFNCFSWDNLY